jgi:hypothetical protein
VPEILGTLTLQLERKVGQELRGASLFKVLENILMNLQRSITKNQRGL